MGRIPEQIISAFVETKDGITRPGQSQRHRPGSTYRVCAADKSRAHQVSLCTHKSRREGGRAQSACAHTCIHTLQTEGEEGPAT